MKYKLSGGDEPSVEEAFKLLCAYIPDNDTYLKKLCIPGNIITKDEYKSFIIKVKKTLLMLYHPDKNQNKNSEISQNINQAIDVLQKDDYNSYFQLIILQQPTFTPPAQSQQRYNSSTNTAFRPTRTPHSRHSNFSKYKNMLKEFFNQTVEDAILENRAYILNELCISNSKLYGEDEEVNKVTNKMCGMIIFIQYKKMSEAFKYLWNFEKNIYKDIADAILEVLISILLQKIKDIGTFEEFTTEFKRYTNKPTQKIDVLEAYMWSEYYTDNEGIFNVMDKYNQQLFSKYINENSYEQCRGLDTCVTLIKINSLLYSNSDGRCYILNEPTPPTVKQLQKYVEYVNKNKIYGDVDKNKIKISNF